MSHKSVIALPSIEKIGNYNLKKKNICTKKWHFK